MTQSLSNLNVIITRPVLQSQSLIKKVLAHHGNPILFPALEIIDVKDHSLLNSVLSDIEQYDLAIFVSQNAVKRVAPFFSKSHRIKIAAIGQSTAKSLLQFKINVDYVPSEKFDSEHLLDLPIFKQIENQKILIFSGEGGRNWLQERLQNKKAQVIKIPVYRRQCPKISLESATAITIQRNCIIISTSCESLENLISIMKQHAFERWLYQTPLLIISERMQKFALTQGFGKSLLVPAENATDQTILDSLIKWYAKKKVMIT